jgi:hypothetical protein
VLDVVPEAGAAHVLRVALDESGRENRLAEASRRRSLLSRGPRGDVSL